MADVSKIKLPNGTTYNIKDENALPLTGGSVTGPVSFGDSVSIDEATIGDLVVNGSASFTNGAHGVIDKAKAADVTSTLNALVKYEDTEGTFSDSNIYNTSNNLIIGSTSVPGNIQIGAKNDNYGILPNTNNYNQIGSSSLYWYRAYINNYYGLNSHVTNWDAGKNIGTSSTSSAAATLGSVYFYNACAAGGTQTKTLLSNGSATSNITITLPSTTGTLALTSQIPDISGKADKATTLAGYGITDAKIASGTITLGSNTITPLTSSSTLNAAKLSGAIPSAITATTQASTDNSTKIATTAYVTTAIANLPEPMVFKGSVGTGGTVTSLPTAAASNEGWTYKVITALSSPAAKVGDTVISNGSSWVVIPSGDEPSGTVTSVGVSNATNGGLTVSGSPVTSAGTITIGHSNVLSSAQTTQAVYPIKIDKNGHISAYGGAITIPTKTSQLTNDSGFITTDTNTTYALSGALSSHKFTSTLTAGGSGSGTSTSDFTLAAGTGITITDDTSARKMTIACSVTNTDTKVSTAAVTSGTTYYPVLGSDTTSAATKYYDKTGISYVGTSGGGSVNGIATLTLGNNVSDGNGKYGKLTIYSASQYGATFQTGSAFTADRTFSLPDRSGYIALEQDFNSYLRKPTGDNPFGWRLSSVGTDVPVWEPPETCIIGVSDDSENPGSYTLINTPDEIRDGSNSTLVLDLNMYNSSTDDFDMHRLVNYRIENIHEANDYMYQIIWFSGITNYRDGTQIKSRKILCGIYLDYDGQYHTDGEVTVTISEIGEAHTLTGSKSLAKSTTFSQIGMPLMLEPGTWMLVGTVEFPGKSDSTYRGISWYSSGGNILASMVSQPAINSTLSTRLQTTLLTTITETAVYTLYGAQNSSSSLTVDWYYRYVKLD